LGGEVKTLVTELDTYFGHLDSEDVNFSTIIPPDAQAPAKNKSGKAIGIGDNVHLSPVSISIRTYSHAELKVYDQYSQHLPTHCRRIKR
jgi:hypothetical protein